MESGAIETCETLRTVYVLIIYTQIIKTLSLIYILGQLY